MTAPPAFTPVVTTANAPAAQTGKQYPGRMAAGVLLGGGSLVGIAWRFSQFALPPIVKNIIVIIEILEKIPQLFQGFSCTTPAIQLTTCPVYSMQVKVIRQLARYCVYRAGRRFGACWAKATGCYYRGRPVAVPERQGDERPRNGLLRYYAVSVRSVLLTRDFHENTESSYSMKSLGIA